MRNQSLIPRRKRKLNSEINTVPYIDVMLVLLVIFMMTTPIIEQGIEVDLPKSGGGEIIDFTESYPSIVSIDKSGKYYLNSIDTTEDSVENTLAVIATQLRARRQVYPQMQIYVRADKSVVYEKVIALMSYLDSSGIEKVGLLTESVN